MSLRVPEPDALLFDRILRQRLAPSGSAYARYRDDPAGYARDVLKVVWWDKQIEIAQSLLTYPKTLVRASHGVGKTFLAGSLVNWHYDCFNPGITLTTAPTGRQVRNLLWKEVRVQRRGRPGLLPRAPRMYDSPNHYAEGFTASDANSFQGTHEERLLFIFDEAVGVDLQFWEAVGGMLTSGAGNIFLAIYNPTDSSSQAYQAEQEADTNVIEISALDHPNIKAELAGLPPPFPAAVRLSWLQGLFEDPTYATPVDAADATPEDVEFPPGSGQWYRPGAYIEGRALARWPSSAVDAIWSEALFKSTLTPPEDPEPYEDELPQLGCDVARQGDDFTAIHVRQSYVSLHHESHNGWDTMQTVGRIIELAREHAGAGAQEMPLAIDDDGVGGGVTDRLLELGYNVVRVSAGSRAIDPERYPGRRDELWFAVRDRALERRLDLSRLPEDVKVELRRQCLAPKWRQDSQGRRAVESKDQTKKRIKRSPDDADAMNLAYAPPVQRRRIRVSSGGRRRR